PLCRILPQHAAAGAAVPVVLRAAGTAAARRRAVAEATAERAVLDGGNRGWLIHVGARRRAAWGRRRVAAAWAEAGGDRAGSDHGADLSLRPAAAGVPYHPAAADVGIPQHHQEYRGRHHDRPDRADRPGALDAGILLPGV